ncbi:MAG TPA: mechanosensitive ion channel domain-containing protein [Chthonomonadales bacterium]|nr:mechanosensitive ion channel domain-containing protein [Chthonomonadales bacterium]
MFTQEYWVQIGRDALQAASTSGLRILIILLIYVAARRALFRIIEAALARALSVRGASQAGTEEHARRLRTLLPLARSVAGCALFFVAAVMVLDALGANVAGIIATAGIGGLAIGFGAQRLVRDVIAGFLLVAENQLAVGEHVTVGGAAGTTAGAGVTGVVEELGLRVLRIRDEGDRLWTIANGDISAVTNLSRAPVREILEVAVGPAADVGDVRSRIESESLRLAAADGSRLIEAPVILGVSAFDATRTVIQIQILSRSRDLPSETLRVREAMLARMRSDGVPLA